MVQSVGGASIDELISKDYGTLAKEAKSTPHTPGIAYQFLWFFENSWNLKAQHARANPTVRLKSLLPPYIQWSPRGRALLHF